MTNTTIRDARPTGTNFLTLACIAAAIAAGFVAIAGRLEAQPIVSQSDTETVGHTGDGRVVTPVNQMVTPYGRVLDLPGLRPQALALSPDGKLLVTSGKTSELIVIDPSTGAIRQRVPLPPYNAPAQVPVSEQILNPDEKTSSASTA